MKKKGQVDIANSKLAKRDSYTRKLETIRNEGICPFCEDALLKHHTKPILFKNRHWIVTKNAWPYEGTKHHFLLISRMHTENAEELPESAFRALHTAYTQLCETYSLSGATLVMRSGDMAYTGATVSHLHAQIIVGQKRTKTSAPITAVVGYKKK